MFPKVSNALVSAGRVAAVALATVALCGGAIAQSYDCDRLRAQIANASSRPSGGAQRYAAAAQKQQYELNRTSSYAASIGCNNRQFLMFGSPPPPQCAGLDAQIQRMRANLAGLQDQARSVGGDGQRQALQARFDATCRQPRGFFETLFDGDHNHQLRQVPIEDAPDRSTEPVDDDRPRGGGSMAVCVRSCDGGYFPISYRARSARIDSLTELCQAQCPGTETALYTMPPGGAVEQAVSADGEAYTDLPNASKFRKAFDPTCACKPKNKSWVEALQQAEELMGRKSRTDVIVTPEKSDELSRPKNATQRADKVLKPSPAANNVMEPTGAPIASPDQTSTTPSKGGSGTTFGLQDGETSDKTDPGGGQRRIRVIGPKF